MMLQQEVDNIAVPIIIILYQENKHVYKMTIAVSFDAIVAKTVKMFQQSFGGPHRKSQIYFTNFCLGFGGGGF